MRLKRKRKNQRILPFLKALLCLFISASSFAQSPVFRPLQLPEALHNTTFNCMYQDNKGVLWLGTGKGLYKFNGKEYQLIPVRSNARQIQASALYMDATSKLWVGTKKGEIYWLISDSLTAFQPKEGLPKKAITGFASDGRGNFWLSTYGEGLYYFNGRYMYNLNSDDGLSDDYCYTIVPDNLGRIWAATDEGISVCFATEKFKKVEKITTEQGLPDNIVLSLLSSGNGVMWVGMQDGGVCSVNTNNLKTKIPAASVNWKYGPVKDMMIFNDLLWVTSDKNGVLELDPATNRPMVSYHSADNFEFPKVTGLLGDNQGNTWISTNNDLILSTGPGFKQLKSLGKMNLGGIQSILQDHLGNLWYSTEGNLIRFTPGSPELLPRKIQIPLLSHTHIISLYEDTMGYIWAGTFGNGLLRVNPVTGKARLINEKGGLTNGNILAITGKGNDIWLATLGGAYHCLLGEDARTDAAILKFENFNQQNGPGNNYIYSVFIDSKRRVWFGTDGKGISVLENGQFRSYGESNGLRSKVVYSITEDQDGKIWFTTSNAGVYSFDGKAFRNYTTANGLSDNQISCIASDRQHHVLFANNHGVDILDIRNGSFTYYGPELGIEGIDPDLNVISGNNTELFWIGTRTGIIRVEIPRNSPPLNPALQLNRVSVFLGTENYIDRHEFAYNQNHLSFFYNAAWYASPDLVTYQIKLEGYDLDWNNTRDNLATYSNLPAGEYNFIVRAALKGNFSNAVSVSYSFQILKPYWKTWWFISTSIIVFVFIVLLLVRMRESRIKQKENMEREKLLFQFQTLRSQVNPHFLFNSFSTLMSVIDEDKEMAIEYVQKLSQFFRNILEYRDKDLISVAEELKLIETYQYLQHQRYGENFIMEISIPDEIRQTLIPPLTLQMLIENAIKHNIVSTDRPLKVSIYNKEKHLVISNNLQRKKLVESSTGIGLVNIKNRYKLLGFEMLTIQETLSDFIIQLPLIKP
ncbi:MAG: histidine kinase [Bacteroidetes bacterium]|nr:histidine kinase [Bacteroidota bacterium]